MDIETLKRIAMMVAYKGQIDLSSLILVSESGKILKAEACGLPAHVVRGCIARKKDGKRQRLAITVFGLLLLDGKNIDCKGFLSGSRSGTLRGRVVSGLGEGQHYISKEGYQKQFREKLGFEPFPGTLNIKLDRPFEPTCRQAIKIEGFLDEGRTLGKCICYRVKVQGIEAAIVRPERSSYTLDLAEVIAPISLRSSLGLADGSEVTITLEDK
jgi:riboflavin kinase